jgi:tetratricopeptide (TPR) repeat protein
MSKLLEVFGRAVTVNVADLIWQWLNCVKTNAIKKSYEKDFDDILELLAQRDLEEAGCKLQFYLFENPSCTAGRMAAAAIYLHKNLIPQAIEELNSVYMREPTNTLALYALGSCFERLGQEAEAIEFYQDALKFKGYLTLPRQRLAAIYLKNEQLGKAIHEYEELTNECPDDVASLVTLGYLYIANMQYEQAIETFDKAILIHPDNFHCDENDDIDMLLQIEEFEQASEKLRLFLEQDNDRADLHLKLADVLNVLGDHDEAVVHLEHSLRIEPDCLEARIKYGMCLLRAGHIVSASNEFAKAMEINDEIIDAYIGLATAQRMSDKTREAYGTLSLAAAIAPNSVLLFAQLAALQFRSTSEADSISGWSEDTDVSSPGTHEEIMKAVFARYTQYLANQPDNADAHYRCGLLLLHGANLTAATQCFANALAINTMHYRASAKLAICLYEMGKKSEAAERLAAATLPDSQTLKLYYKAAILFSNQAQFHETAKELQSTLRRSLAQTSAVPNLSVVLQNLGLADRAAGLLEYPAEPYGDCIA